MEVHLFGGSSVWRFICLEVHLFGGNVIGSHSLIGSGTIRRYGFVGVGVVLLEEVCHCGGGLCGFLCSGYCPVSQLTSYCLQGVGLSATATAPRLPVHDHAPHYDDKGLNL